MNVTRLYEAVERAANEAAFRQRAEHMQQLMREAGGYQRAADAIMQFTGEHARGYQASISCAFLSCDVLVMSMHDTAYWKDLHQRMMGAYCGRTGFPIYDSRGRQKTRLAALVLPVVGLLVVSRAVVTRGPSIHGTKRRLPLSERGQSPGRDTYPRANEA